jgi:flavin reductase (DIM6/NTAB) family NADH-FMN oxidoreductase RutF
MQPKKRPPKPEPPEKLVWKPGTMLFPVPVVMVTCVAEGQRPNIITIAWTGIVCSEPPMLSISVRKERHSYGLIMKSRQFVVNIPSVKQIRLADYCGVVSGRDVDKFAETGLTAGPASTVAAPLILECPVHLECAVRKTMDLGTHTMFLAEITTVQVTKHLVNPSGRFAAERAGLTAFAHGSYYPLGSKTGFFGFSIQKHKNPKKKK